MSAVATISTWLRQRPAKCAAWKRYRVARDGLRDSRVAFEVSPNDLTAQQVRWAEIEVDDAIAVAGEFELPKGTWSLW
jgi:hypothetical protein